MSYAAADKNHVQVTLTGKGTAARTKRPSYTRPSIEGTDTESSTVSRANKRQRVAHVLANTCASGYHKETTIFTVKKQQHLVSARTPFQEQVPPAKAANAPYNCPSCHDGPQSCHLCNIIDHCAASPPCDKPDCDGESICFDQWCTNDHPCCEAECPPDCTKDCTPECVEECAQACDAVCAEPSCHVLTWPDQPQFCCPADLANHYPLRSQTSIYGHSHLLTTTCLHGFLANECLFCIRVASHGQALQAHLPDNLACNHGYAACECPFCLHNPSVNEFDHAHAADTTCSHGCSASGCPFCMREFYPTSVTRLSTLSSPQTSQSSSSGIFTPSCNGDDPLRQMDVLLSPHDNPEEEHNEPDTEVNCRWQSLDAGTSTSAELRTCNHTFLNHKTLHNHIKNVHTSLLEQSGIAKSGLSSYPCQWLDCGKCFGTKNHLDRHMCSHSGYKPFGCNYPGCTYRCVTQQQLNNHKPTHTGEKKYICEVCNRGFGVPTALTTHMRAAHTRAKPFSCEFCGDRYADSSNLCKHKTGVHHVDKGIHCPDSSCSYVDTRQKRIEEHCRGEKHGLDLLNDSAAWQAYCMDAKKRARELRVERT